LILNILPAKKYLKQCFFVTFAAFCHLQSFPSGGESAPPRTGTGPEQIRSLTLARRRKSNVSHPPCLILFERRAGQFAGWMFRTNNGRSRAGNFTLERSIRASGVGFSRFPSPAGGEGESQWQPPDARLHLAPRWRLKSGPLVGGKHAGYSYASY
jgi:hypothetical protein